MQKSFIYINIFYLLYIYYLCNYLDFYRVETIYIYRLKKLYSCCHLVRNEGSYASILGNHVALTNIADTSGSS